MPSQAETIAALQGLNPVTTPQSPANPYAAAMTFGSAIGLPDAIKALKGQLTPEEAKNFALTSAMGLLPGGKAETVAAKTMGELLPHLYPEASSFAKMTPKESLGMFGSDLPKQLPQDVENVLKPYMQPAKAGKVPGPGPVQQFAPKELTKATMGSYALKQMGDANEGMFAVHGPNGKIAELTLTGVPNQWHLSMDNLPFSKNVQDPLQGLNAAATLHQKIEADPGSVTPASLAKEHGMVYPPIDKTAISNALAKNPGASIFDVANTHVGGQSSPLSAAMGNAGLDQTFPQNLFRDIPREGGIQYTPTKASILGKSENLVHGTRVPQTKWHGEIGSSTDALKLPDDELGVHFGNPKQAQVFSGDWLSREAQPRQYPVVVSTNNPLELPDLGTWHLEDVTQALKKANTGELRGRAGYERQPNNHAQFMPISPETVGQFPPHELNQIDSIEGMRDYLQSKGYNSIKYVNKAEDSGANSFIKFTPSPEAPNFVTGVRSPFAAFDPSKIMRPELAAGLAGGTLAAPAIDPNLLKALTGGQTDQQQ